MSDGRPVRGVPFQRPYQNPPPDRLTPVQPAHPTFIFDNTAADDRRRADELNSKPTGWVYLIREVDTDFAKVGYTVRHPEKPGDRGERSRLAKMQTGNPRRLRFVKAYRGSKKHEAGVRHAARYAEVKHVRGEWFEDPDCKLEGVLDRYFRAIHGGQAVKICPDCGEESGGEVLCECEIRRFQLP